MDLSMEPDNIPRCELDSHADTTAAGSNMIMLDDPLNVTQHVTVSPFSDEYAPIHNVPVATCATAWESPYDGTTTILIFHQALYFGDRLQHSLLCPNQIRDYNNNEVHDTPRQYMSDSKHGLLLKDDDHQLFIPLHLHGVISYLPSRKPTQLELDECPHIVVTSEQPWDPHSSRFQEDEEAIEASDPVVTTNDIRVQNLHRLMSSLNIVETAIADDGLLAHRLESQLHGPICGDPLNIPNRSVNSLHSSLGATITQWGPLISTPDGPGRTNAEALAARWHISLKKARETIKVTTQKGIRNIQQPLVRRLRTQPYRNKVILSGKWYTDAIHFKNRSITRDDKVGQLFTNGKGYDEIYPVQSTSQSHEGLMQFVGNIGIPEILVSDNANTQGSLGTRNTHWNRLVSRYHIRQQFIQPHCPWQNLAEHSASSLRSAIRRMTAQKQSPRRLWAYCAKLAVGRKQRTSASDSSLLGRTPFEAVRGYTPDITMYMIHDWYDFVWWYDCGDKEEKLGRWLGPCGDRYGGGDCHFILPFSTKIRVTNSTRPLTQSDWKNPDILRKMREINDNISSKLGDSIPRGDESVGQEHPEFPEDLFVGTPEGNHVDMQSPEDSIPDVDEFQTHDMGYDEYLGARVLMKRGGEDICGIIKKRTKDEHGAPIGTRNQNPILDTRMYEVQMSDGSTETYTTNMIAENLYSTVDDNGNSFVLMDEIIDHERDGTAINEADAFDVCKNGQKKFKPTTRGWRLLVNWKDGSSSWVKLSDMKESFPIQTAQYAVDNQIADRAAFRWWVHRVLRKKDRILSGAKTKYWMRTHKYGVRLPKSIDEALRLDRETNTTFWRDAIDKEMKNSSVAFEFTEGEDERPVGYKKITMHMVFDVKIDLTRKARLCADGHKVPEVPKETTYSSVPSRDTIRIFFLLAALNGLKVLSADIQNAYLTAPIKEKYYTVATKEQGFSPEYWGRTCKIVRALYGLPVAGASFRSHLVRNLRELGYSSCKADPDIHMRPAFKPDGTEYWEYCIAYVDDILVTGHDVKEQMNGIERRFKLKNGTVEEPSFYLGADISKLSIGTDTYWSMSSQKYTAKAVATVEAELNTSKFGYKYLKATATTPLSADYRPEIDSSPELGKEAQNYYQGLIGILRWICELGRLDIIMPVSLLSRYLAQAREGHLEQVFHIFAYLKKYNKSKLVFDASYPEIDEGSFQECDWKEFYPEAKEAIPSDAPRSRGKSVVLNCFVDADHAGCKATRRSHSGVIVFINRAPILWFSKRQSTVETSTFGSEIVAMRIAVELIEGLRYKLRMMGVGIDGPTNVFCDNDSVVKNTTRPESVCKKKHNSIAYHKIRESIAAATIRVAKEPGETNVADLLTKLMGGARFRDLCS